MSEKILSFGTDQHLSGLLTAPTALAPEAPLVVIINAGIVHHIGAHRLHVNLARALAQSGAGAALRFDLSGLGDSRPAPQSIGFEAQSLADISAAIDAGFESVGERPVVALGMCSGADNAYRAALDEPRISAIALLDPYAYAEKGAKLSQLASKVADPTAWRRKLSHLAQTAATSLRPGDEAATAAEELAPLAEEEAGSAALNGRPFPPLEAFGTGLQSLTARGVHVLMLYTNFVAGEMREIAQFHRQFAAFDFHDRLEARQDLSVDHTYTMLDQQRALIAALCDWINDQAPRP
ncbi:MAG: alpha/beta hydrolase [Neomegalonema sp.]|nr:alpha/beta hydrolase [Neomegalonema sp.]